MSIPIAKAGHSERWFRQFSLYILYGQIMIWVCHL